MNEEISQPCKNRYLFSELSALLLCNYELIQFHSVLFTPNIAFRATISSAGKRYLKRNFQANCATSKLRLFAYHNKVI